MPGHKPRTNKGLAIAAVLMCLACGVSFTQSSASHSPTTDTQTPDMFVAGNTDDSQIQSDGAAAENTDAGEENTPEDVIPTEAPAADTPAPDTLSGSDTSFEVSPEASQGAWTPVDSNWYFLVNGEGYKGWLTDTDEYKYYFYSGSGVMAKGWVENKKEQKRYFSQANGRMCTGWVKSSAGNYRYFKPSNGIMYTGLEKIDSDYYYFSKSTGVRYQKGFGTVGSKKYYFNPSDGKAKTGWLELDGKKYYFDTSGVMLANTIASIDGTTYRFDSDGAATKTSDNDYTVEGKYVKVFDAKNNKYYYMEEEFLEHPGIADGKVSDLDLLAAVCDAEAGDQGVVGMEAVALCVLNCTIDQYKEFPSQIRYVVYQGKPTQYAVVTDGALLKRLKGQFEDRTNAYAAAKAAMEVFSNYVNHGTKRTLPGFKTKDFNYKFFMTPAAFKAQNLNFSKLEYEQYKGHVFFVDWISG